MNHFVLSLGAQQWTKQTQPYVTELIVLGGGCKQDPGDYRHMINVVGGTGRLLDTHFSRASSQPGLRCPCQEALLFTKVHCFCMDRIYSDSLERGAEGMALLSLGTQRALGSRGLIYTLSLHEKSSFLSLSRIQHPCITPTFTVLRAH